jgi:glycosyltransferase involved in cell wall biosynthesis
MENQKKVCFFINTLAVPGGTQRVLTTLVNQLVNGYNVSIIVTDSLEKVFALDDRVNVVMISPVRNKLLLWKNSMDVYFYLKRNSIDFFIVLDANISLVYNCIVPRGCQSIVWEHLSLQNNQTSLFCKFSRWISTKCVTKFILINDFELKCWREKYALPANKTIKIPNAVNFQNTPLVDPEKLFANRKLLAIGNDIHIKGFDLLLESWKILDAKDWLLQIVGLTEKRANKLRGLIAEYGLELSVELVPPVNNIEKYYENASIFCVSSRSEVLPMVLIEAQAYGLPAVCFPCGGGPIEIVNNSGIICTSYSVNEYAKALNDIISNRDLFVKFSKAAQSVIDKFNIKNIAQQWDEILK